MNNLRNRLAQSLKREAAESPKEIMEQLLATLILYGHNLRIMHWNITGLDFDPVHSLLGDYYDKLSELVDDVAELAISLDIQPITLAEALEKCKDCIVLDGKETYSSKDCFQHVENMFQQLIEMYESMYTGYNIPESIISILQEHQQWLRKECQYKNKRRIK